MLVARNRAFTKEPSRVGQAKSFYIFCEGVKRERQYFRYFKELDSRVNVEVYPLNSKEDNSPSGLLEIAYRCMFGTETDAPKYEYLEGDEVWLVFDTDPDKFNSRKPQVVAIRNFCKLVAKQRWFAAESNPCFEAWLYFHKEAQLIDFENQEQCSSWKMQLAQRMGGFNSQKHPIFIQTALINAKSNFNKKSNTPTTGSTEVYQLAEHLLFILRKKIALALKRMNVDRL
jgi:hypothetical protein